MREHQLPFQPSEPSVPNQPETAGTIEARLEDYLDRVFAPLVWDIPYAERQEMRAEMQSHLLATIAAHRELGSTPEEALKSALRQFGNPKKIAARWHREWERTQLRSDGRCTRATRLALLGGLAVTIVLANAFMAWYYTNVFVLENSWRGDFTPGPGNINSWSYLDCLSGTVHCVPMMLAALIAGLRLRPRPVLSVFWTVLVTFPMTVIGIDVVRFHYHLAPNRTFVFEVKDLIANWTPFYVMSACLSAYVGVRLQQWQQQSRYLWALR